jgi:phosphate acetyltransferase
VVRKLVCQGLDTLGISIDQEANSNKGAGIAQIQSASSAIKVLVVPTNEELSITLQSISVANIRVPRKQRVSQPPLDRARKTSSFKMAGRKVSVFMTQKYAKAQETALADGVKESNSVYVLSMSGRGTALFELGLFHRLHRLDPEVGFFRPISNRPNSQDTHADLIHSTFQLKDNKDLMCGVDYEEAVNLLSTRQEDLLIDKIVEAYEKYRFKKRFVLISGINLPVTSMDINLTIAAILRSPVLFQLRYNKDISPQQHYEKVMLNRARMKEIPGSKFSGVAINRIPTEEYADFNTEFRAVMKEHDVPVAAVLPLDKVLTNFRVNEIYGALTATVLYGHSNMDRFETANFLIASGSTEQVLKECAERKEPCMVLVDAGRMDVLLALLFSIQSTNVSISGVVLTGATAISPLVKSLLDSVPTVELPVLMARESLEEVIAILKSMSPTVLPSSKAKIEVAEGLFDQYMDETYLESMVQSTGDAVMTPKLFQYQIMKQARSSKRHIVLPEGNDKRVVSAAAELVQRGLCKVTVIGNPQEVNTVGNQLKVDLSDVNIVDPGTSSDTQRYADMLYEARKEKGMTPEKALDLVTMDPNYYGTMMMHRGLADGMVSGACHTTADTMRPALQIIKTAPGFSLVSSVFFMLLPKQVYVYGDCAINVDPNAEQLGNIAASSALTAQAFGIEPRVAMLSYATGDSNKGDLITKVKDATDLALTLVPESVHIEGPMQFDAAVDPEVAKVKVKTASNVAGKATVCVFPDLNTGNNTYKAVQQASGCIAMGPIMQGLRKPVNDLSRGCTVDDIVNTCVITCIQAIGAAAQN